MQPLKILTWTAELADSFWSDLANSDFLAGISFSKFAAPLLADLAEQHLRKDDAILDFGAGAHLYLVQELLRRGFTVGYYEPNSSSRADIAQVTSSGCFLGSVSDLDHRQYDCVFLSEVIEHLSDESLRGVLSILERIVKAGGLLVVTTPDSEDLLSASRYCPVCRHLFHPWGHVRSFNSEQLRTLLANYGFECHEMHSVDFSAAREPIEELKQLRAVIADIKRDVTTHTEESDLGSNEVMRTLRKHIERLSHISGPHVPEDPQHRRIGFGGTLVAFARRRAVPSEAPRPRQI